MSDAFAEAKTMAIWGQSQEEISNFLIGDGVHWKEAEKEAARLMQERHLTIRKRGCRRIILGALVCGLTTALFYWNLQQEIDFRMGRRLPLLLVGFCWAIWKITDGVLDVWRPQSRHGNAW